MKWIILALLVTACGAPEETTYHCGDLQHAQKFCSNELITEYERELLMGIGHVGY